MKNWYKRSIHSIGAKYKPCNGMLLAIHHSPWAIADISGYKKYSTIKLRFKGFPGKRAPNQLISFFVTNASVFYFISQS